MQMEIQNSSKRYNMQRRGALAALGVFVSSVFGILCVMSLESEDRISVRRGALLTATGFVYFISLFEFTNHLALGTAIGRRFRKEYHLRVSDVMDINNKVVSAVQAALCCLSGAVVCMWSCTRSMIHTSHFASEAYAWFGAAYFFYDIWSMYKVHACAVLEGGIGKLRASNGLIPSKAKPRVVRPAELHDANKNLCADRDSRDSSQGSVRSINPAEKDATLAGYIRDQPMIVAHHVLIGSLGFLVITYFRGGFGDCVFGFAYLMELSTPFVSFRGILSILGMKASKWYLVNGLVMLGTFFVCRVAMMPYVCLMYSRAINKPYLQAIWSLPTGCKTGIAVLMVPQIYWFGLMLRGAVKVFWTAPNSTAPTALKAGGRRSRKQKSNQHS